MSSTIDAPLEWVETVGNLRLPPRADQRLQALMDRNNEGLLTETERAELEALVELSERLSLVARRGAAFIGTSAEMTSWSLMEVQVELRAGGRCEYCQMHQSLQGGDIPRRAHCSAVSRW